MLRKTNLVGKITRHAGAFDDRLPVVEIIVQFRKIQKQTGLRMTRKAV